MAMHQRFFGTAGLALLLLAGSTLTTPATAALQGPHPRPVVDRPDDDPDLLKKGERGDAALDALGDRLPEAARRNGISPGKLRKALRDDPTARIGRNGKLSFTDPVPASPGPRAAHAESEAPATEEEAASAAA